MEGGEKRTKILIDFPFKKKLHCQNHEVQGKSNHVGNQNSIGFRHISVNNPAKTSTTKSNQKNIGDIFSFFRLPGFEHLWNESPCR